MFSHILFWLMIFVGISLGADYFIKQLADQKTATKPNAALPLPAPPTACVGTPPPDNGAVRIIDPSVMKRTDAVFSGVRFENQLALHVVATFMVGSLPVGAVLVHPGQTAELSAPVGTYPY